jgi:hypothetical protein
MAKITHLHLGPSIRTSGFGQSLGKSLSFDTPQLIQPSTDQREPQQVKQAGNSHENNSHGRHKEADENVG